MLDYSGRSRNARVGWGRAALATLAAASIESAILAQSTQPSAPSPEPPSTAPATTAPATTAPAPSAPLPIVRRAPLIREGSSLVEVVGRLGRDPRLGWWIFTIDAADPQSPGHELAMLPNGMLDEMERLVASADDRQFILELTGEVFVYRGRNFLLATHPPVLIGHEPKPTTPAPSDAAGLDEGDAAEDIIRELQAAAGNVARRAAPPASTPPTGERRIREGAILVDRRGKIRRTPQGAYLFLFDADAHGEADPPMLLLPCLMLEHLDRFARQEGGEATVLLSGDVSTFHGRSYLRPTVYRVPRGRTKLSP